MNNPSRDLTPLLARHCTSGRAPRPAGRWNGSPQRWEERRSRSRSASPGRGPRGYVARTCAFPSELPNPPHTATRSTFTASIQLKFHVRGNACHAGTAAGPGRAGAGAGHQGRALALDTVEALRQARDLLGGIMEAHMGAMGGTTAALSGTTRTLTRVRGRAKPHTARRVPTTPCLSVCVGDHMTRYPYEGAVYLCCTGARRRQAFSRGGPRPPPSGGPAGPGPNPGAAPVGPSVREAELESSLAAMEAELAASRAAHDADKRKLEFVGDKVRWASLRRSETQITKAQSAERLRNPCEAMSILAFPDGGPCVAGWQVRAVAERSKSRGTMLVRRTTLWRVTASSFVRASHSVKPPLSPPKHAHAWVTQGRRRSASSYP